MFSLLQVGYSILRYTQKQSQTSTLFLLVIVREIICSGPTRFSPVQFDTLAPTQELRYGPFFANDPGMLCNILKRHPS